MLLGQLLNGCAARDRDVRLAVSDVIAETARLHNDLATRVRVLTELGQRRLSCTAATLLRLRINLTGLLLSDRENLFLGLQRAVVHALLEVRTKATIRRNNLRTVGIRAHVPWKRHELHGLFERDRRRAHPLKQARGLRLLLSRLLLRLRVPVLVVLGRDRIVISLKLFLRHLRNNLSHVRTVTAVLSHNHVASLRVAAQLAVTLNSGIHEFLSLLRRQLIRSQVLRNIRTQRLLARLRILRECLLKIRAKLTHAQGDVIRDLDRVDRAGIDLAQVINDVLQTLGSIITEIERRQPVLIFELASGDLIQVVLKTSREIVIHVLAEVLLEQADHRERGPRRNQRATTLGDITAVHDRRNRRSVRRRAADLTLLKLSNNRGFRVAGRRRRLVTLCLDVLARQRITLRQLRQPNLLALLLSFLALTFLVSSKETRERDDRTRRRELSHATIRGLTLNLDRGRRTLRISHLRSHSALPDQLIQTELIRAQNIFDLRRGAERIPRRADRLVSLLRGSILRRIHARLRSHMIRAIQLGDLAASSVDRLTRKAHRVGTHIGDETVLIQTLRNLHRDPRRETQLTRSILLQSRGRKRSKRTTRVRLFLNRNHRTRRTSQPISQRRRIGFLQDHHIGLLSRWTQLAFIVEVAARSNAAAVNLRQARTERLARARNELARNIPILRRNERHALTLTLNHQTRSNRLHAASRKPRAHLAPQNRGNLVTVNTVQNTAGLLRIDQIHIQITQVLKSALNRFLGDLREGHPVHRHLRLQNLQKVPGDRFALTVGIGREIQSVSILELSLQIRDPLLLVRVHHVIRLETVFHVHRELTHGRLLQLRRQLFRLRQVTNVTHRRVHDETITQVLGNGLTLRRRLDDHELLTGFILSGGHSTPRNPTGETHRTACPSSVPNPSVPNVSHACHHELICATLYTAWTARGVFCSRR